MSKMSKEEFKESAESLYSSVKLSYERGLVDHLSDMIIEYKEHDPVLAQLIQNDIDNLERICEHLAKKLEVD